jgi:hypothetical protein
VDDLRRAGRAHCDRRADQGRRSDSNTRNTWTNTFSGLAARFPELRLPAVEHGSLPRDIHDVVFGPPARQGPGAFNWEPTHQGAWNMDRALFSVAANRYTETADRSLHDAMRVAYADRL